MPHDYDKAASDSLASALDRCGIQVAADRQPLLQRYCEAVWHWNLRLNLTRHTTYDKFASRDVVDSQQIASLISENQSVLDIGTGAGVPGVVLAILRPDLTVSVCESVGKKARAVSAIVDSLELPVTVVHDRAERLLERAPFDTLVARAVAPLSKLLRWVTPHRCRFQQLLVIKGSQWEAECRQAAELGLLAGLRLETMASYRTPRTQAENVVLRLAADPPA